MRLSAFRCVLLVVVIIGNLVAPVVAQDEAVEISVEVTEVNQNKADQLGINWTNSIAAGEISFSNVADRTPDVLPEVPSIIRVGDWARYTALTAEIKALATTGSAEVLSKPKIVTKSGTTAKVMVGGEIPIVATGVGGGSIEWKEFGIITSITPKVLDKDTIDLSLTTEVSRLDYSNSVNNVPAIQKRSANSSLVLKSGETMLIAGLLETNKSKTRTGLPLLSKIPILGLLFSRETANETKSNVLIFVTPRILK
jgi:pilus assembly protein CpaC